LEAIQLSVEGVRAALASVDPRKARGTDNIPSAVLKICADELAPSLCVLFNKSLELGKLPVEWKNSLIVPIFKKNRKERGQQCDVIYLDFAKAFDSVSHARLIHKLHHYGFRGKVLDWFAHYLSDRTQ
ncbi:predicted protein, partial [Nematostella vectensis]